MALGATYGWGWPADLLKDAGFDVHLAHPLRTRAIAAARVKTDAVDAKRLAHLLRTGMLPEAFIAPPELRDLRELLCHRATLTGLRTSVKNRVHALPARQGILPEHSDLFGSEYLSTLELPDGPRTRLESLLSLIGRLRPGDHRHHRPDRRARKSRRACSAALPDPGCRPLHRDARDRRGRRGQAVPDTCAPGQGSPRPSAAPTARPASGTSPGKAPRRCDGHRSKPRITSPFGGGPLRAQLERIAKRRGRKVATVAIARQIPTLCCYGLRDGEIRCLAPQPDVDDVPVDENLADAA